MARRSYSRPTTWISAVAIVALTVVVAILAIVAIDRSRPAAPDESLAPIPTFEQAPPEPSASPTPTSAPLAPVARADERFLSVSSEGILWRGVAGSCTDEVAPLIERSADGGATWSDVTPLYRGMTQMMRLDAFAGTQAQAVAMLDACAIDGLRTFTQGRFWESYDEVRAESSFIAGGDAGQVVTPDGTVAAPCAEARGLRGAGGTTALVCDGQAFRLTGDEWQALGVAKVVAVATDDSSFVVAHVSSDCPGLALSSVTDASATAIACVEGVDPAQPTAIDVSDDSVLVWSGESFTDIAR